MSFEQIISELTEVVQRLESGDLPLSESLAAFEKGVQLTRLGSRRLDAAEARVEELLADSKTTRELADS